MESGRELAPLTKQPLTKEPLTKDRCLQLIDSVPFGRIIYTSRAMPAVRLVPHARLGEQIVIPASPDLGVTTSETGTVVAYETDLIGAGQQPAWTVLVVGRARLMAVRELPAGQRERLSSWPGGAPDTVVVIATDLVTGEQIRREPGLRIPVRCTPAA